MTTGRINQVNIFHTIQDENFVPVQTTTKKHTRLDQIRIARKHHSLSPNTAFLNVITINRELILHPSEHRKINYDPHFISPVETEQEANNRARYSIRRLLYLGIPHTSPRSSPVLPEFEIFPPIIQRKTYRKRFCQAAHRPKSAHTLNRPSQYSFAPAPIERCCCTSQRQQYLVTFKNMYTGH